MKKPAKKTMKKYEMGGPVMGAPTARPTAPKLPSQANGRAASAPAFTGKLPSQAGGGAMPARAFKRGGKVCK